MGNYEKKRDRASYGNQDSGIFASNSRTDLRIQVISMAIIRSQREGKNIAIRLYEPDAPLYEDEDILLMHRPKRFATSRKRQCLRNMAKRKKRHTKNS